MIELYHFGFSTCSQKVRLALAEKGQTFVSHEVNIVIGEQNDPEYVKLNPKHVVPTLIHDGRVLNESSLIIQYLDDAFAEPRLRPTDAMGRYEVDAWTKHVDDALHPAAPTVTFAIGARRVMLAQPDEVREAGINGIQDPVERATRRSVLANGVKAPEFAGALGIFIDTIDRMERELGQSRWLSGERLGLADISIVPYVLRIEHMGMDPLLDAGVRPRVSDWLTRFKARPSFEVAVGVWTPAPVVAAMRADGHAIWADIEPIVLEHSAQG